MPGVVPEPLSRPAWMWVPDHDSTAGGEAADLAASAGMVADPEQRLVLDAILAERAGRWAAFEAAVIAGRQNLKTWVLEVAALHDLVLRRVGRVVWTAHRYKTAQDSFEALTNVFTNYDHLRRRVHRVTTAAGEQGIRLLPRHSGPRVDFMARAGSMSGRGMTGDTVVLDEGLYLVGSIMGALIPTLSAVPDPQVRYGSSAGLPGSEVLRGLRDRGRPGGDPSLCWIEWGTEPGGCQVAGCDHRSGAPGCVLDDEERWARANPALGRRISLEYVRKERRALTAEEFARERLGWWEDPAVAVSGMDPAAWARAEEPSAVPGDPVAVGIDVAPGHVAAAIVACGSGPEGRPVLEVLAHRRGASWLVPALAALTGAQSGMGAPGMDPAGPAGALIPDLDRAGIEADLLDSRRSIQACGGFAAAVEESGLLHRGDPGLTTAVLGARRRPVGDAWKWSRKDSDVDISPLVAATIARQLWAERSGVTADYDVASSIY